MRAGEVVKRQAVLRLLDKSARLYRMFRRFICFRPELLFKGRLHSRRGGHIAWFFQQSSIRYLDGKGSYQVKMWRKDHFAFMTMLPETFLGSVFIWGCYFDLHFVILILQAWSKEIVNLFGIEGWKTKSVMQGLVIWQVWCFALCRYHLPIKWML